MLARPKSHLEGAISLSAKSATLSCFMEKRLRAFQSLRLHLVLVGDGIVAPPIGLEPMTDWLTASRSTWLSYGGSSANCSLFRRGIKGCSLTNELACYWHWLQRAIGLTSGFLLPSVSKHLIFDFNHWEQSFAGSRLFLLASICTWLGLWKAGRTGLWHVLSSYCWNRYSWDCLANTYRAPRILSAIRDVISTGEYSRTSLHP